MVRMRIAVFVLVCALAVEAVACSCAGPGSPARDFAQYDAVFLARVERTEVLQTRLAVIRSWKGSVPKTLDLKTSFCDYRGFVAGREYLVWAWGPQRVVSMCSRTRPAAEAQLEMQLLDALRAGQSDAAFVKRLPQAMLHDARPAVRAEAARLLARDAPPDVASAAIPSFVRALRDPSAEVRRSVVAALDRGPWAVVLDQQRTVVRALLGVLEDPDPAIRAQVATSLEKGAFVPETEPALRKALAAEQGRAKPDRAVLSALASTLAVVGSPQSKRLVVPLLVRDLQHVGSPFRAQAANRLGKIGPDARPALQPLARLLRDPESYVRYAAAGALGEIGSREAVPHLVAALGDPGFDVRANAAWAIFMTGDDATLGSKAIPVLVRSLETAPRYERYQLIRVIGDVGPAARPAAPILTRLLATEKDSRTSLLQALESVDDRSAPVIRAVHALLQDPDANVRNAAAVLLAKWRVPAGSAYVAQKIVPPLVRQFSSSDASTRVEALRRLNDFDAALPATAVPKLRAMLHASEPWPRALAAEALRNIGTPEARSAFDAFAKEEAVAAARRLATAKGKDRAEAARLLVHLAPHSAVALKELIAGLSDSDWLLRTKSAEALGALGPAAAPATQALTRALDDRNAYVRSAARAALERVKV